MYKPILSLLPSHVRRDLHLLRMYWAIRKALPKRARGDAHDGSTRLSLCTTCRNRHHHLRFTLRANLRDMLSYPNAEIVLVDYGSDKPLDDWILKNFKDELSGQRLRYARVLGVNAWNASHAKNIAHNLATGDVLINVDADNFIGPGFCEYISTLFSHVSRPLVAQGDGNLSCAGRIALRRDDFKRIGGYDEELQAHGFGYEDYDLVRRLEAFGAELHLITDSAYLQAFWHSDQERSSGYAFGVHNIESSSHSNYLRSSSNIKRGILVANHDAGWGRGHLLFGPCGTEMHVSESIELKPFS